MSLFLSCEIHPKNNKDHSERNTFKHLRHVHMRDFGPGLINRSVPENQVTHIENQLSWLCFMHTEYVAICAGQNLVMLQN